MGITWILTVVFRSGLLLIFKSCSLNEPPFVSLGSIALRTPVDVVDSLRVPVSIDILEVSSRLFPVNIKLVLQVKDDSRVVGECVELELSRHGKFLILDRSPSHIEEHETVSRGDAEHNDSKTC